MLWLLITCVNTQFHDVITSFSQVPAWSYLPASRWDVTCSQVHGRSDRLHGNHVDHEECQVDCHPLPAYGMQTVKACSRDLPLLFRSYMYMYMSYMYVHVHVHVDQTCMHNWILRRSFVVVDCAVHRAEVFRLCLHSTRAFLARPHAARRVPTTSRRQGEADAEG